MTSKWHKAGLAALVVGALIFMAWLAGLLYFGKIPPGTVALKAPPLKGEVITVAEREIPREVAILAAAVSKSLAQVSSQVPGRVTRVWVEAGSRVRPGEPLVTLCSEEFQARLSQARAGLAQSQALLTQVAADYGRYRRLLREGAVSPQEFGAMEARYRATSAQVAQAQAQVKEAPP